MKYFLIKDETIRRTERVRYEIEIPQNIRNKIGYADNQVKKNQYKSHKILDVLGGELLDEEVVNLKIKSLFLNKK